MKSIKAIARNRAGLILGAALAGVLVGCVVHEPAPRQVRGYAPPPPVYVESNASFQDDYVYFPEHQIYYNTHRRQYVYLEGSSWVARPAPPRVAVSVLYATPSVRMDFHDSPSVHHATVVRRYPGHRAPAGRGHDHDRDGRDDGRRNDHDGQGKDRR